MVASLSIERHVLPGRALLAPMSGVTDHAFRRIAEDFGAGLVVSEMVAADQLAAGEEEARLRAEGRGLRLHVVQLAGCEAGAMAEGARVAEASGADIIDINMGCPAKRVVHGWSGSALMRDLDHAAGLIAAVKAAVSVPVTLKMRLGWDDASRNAPELARRAAGLGVALVTVHGRTRQQFYRGRADWGAVKRVREAISLPLIVNGDIGTAEQAREAMRLSGADGVMIGRASLGCPWRVGEIAAAFDGRETPFLPGARLAQAVLAHYDSLIESLGPAHGLRHARKHVAAYAQEAARRGAALDAGRQAAVLVSTEPAFVRDFLREAFLAIPASPMREAA